jgi:hypothetical protein
MERNLVFKLALFLMAGWFGDSASANDAVDSTQSVSMSVGWLRLERVEVVPFFINGKRFSMTPEENARSARSAISAISLRIPFNPSNAMANVGRTIGGITLMAFEESYSTSGPVVMNTSKFTVRRGKHTFSVLYGADTLFNETRVILVDVNTKRRVKLEHGDTMQVGTNRYQLVDIALDDDSCTLAETQSGQKYRVMKDFIMQEPAVGSQQWAK